MIRTETEPSCPKEPPAMQSIAAYYVVVATETINARTYPLQVVAPRPSLIARVSAALEMLFRFGRPATTQPI
jgi:hypothetical protein